MGDIRFRAWNTGLPTHIHCCSSKPHTSLLNRNNVAISHLPVLRPQILSQPGKGRLCIKGDVSRIIDIAPMRKGFAVAYPLRLNDQPASRFQLSPQVRQYVDWASEMLDHLSETDKVIMTGQN